MFLPSNITLKFGDTGDFVAELQRRLSMVGCFAEDQVNGFYEGATVTGVTRFQSMQGIHADGVAGPETLRRLNGVISGDTSGGSADTKNEEAQRTETHTMLNQWMVQPPEALLDPTMLSPSHAPQPDAPLAPSAPIQEPVWAQPVVQHQAAMPPQDLHLREPQHAPVHAPAAPANDLASMLLNQLQPQVPQSTAMQPEPQQHARPAFQERPIEPQSAMMAAPVQAQAFAAPAPALQPPVQQAPAVAPQPAAQPMAEPQGLIGKTVQFANAMMQKVSDYFEAKLPPSVLKEVQNIGLNMAQSGIKEAPIPTGPDMGGPSQLPARGPDQPTPQMQRGN